MNIPEDVMTTYEQVLCTITQAITWARKGNVPETTIAVDNLKERTASLELRFGRLARLGELNRLLETKDTTPTRQSTVIRQYIEKPDAILAEAYLISAENALITGDIETARKCYDQIEQGAPLRDYLDEPIDGDESLVYRAQELDLNPVLREEFAED